MQKLAYLNQSNQFVTSWQQTHEIFFAVYVSDGYLYNFVVQSVTFYNFFPRQHHHIYEIDQVLQPVRIHSNTRTEFYIKSDSFYDIDPLDKLEYSAIHETGNALPGWLEFNTQNEYFVATPTFDQLYTQCDTVPVVTVFSKVDQYGNPYQVRLVECSIKFIILISDFCSFIKAPVEIILYN